MAKKSNPKRSEVESNETGLPFMQEAPVRQDLLITDTKRHEKSIAQWAELERTEIPGVKHSDLPAFFLVPCPGMEELEDHNYVSLQSCVMGSDKSRWHEIPDKLLSGMRAGGNDSLQLPDGWSYEALLQDGAAPHPYQLLNPRLYQLDGKSVPQERGLGSLARLCEIATRHLLTDLFQSTPPNLRQSEIDTCLNYHLSAGGNPERFKELVERILKYWSSYPLMVLDHDRRRRTGENIKVIHPEHGLLSRYVGQWLGLPASPVSTAKPVRQSHPKRQHSEMPLVSKFNAVPGSLERWMRLLRAEGLVDEAGSFTMAREAKNKGKLVAAWVAAAEVFHLVAYPLDTELTKALIAHLPNLSGLDRLDKVRKTKGFTDNVERYKEALQDD